MQVNLFGMLFNFHEGNWLVFCHCMRILLLLHKKKTKKMHQYEYIGGLVIKKKWIPLAPKKKSVEVPLRTYGLNQNIVFQFLHMYVDKM